MIDNIEDIMDLMTNDGMWAIRDENGIHIKTSKMYNKLLNGEMKGVNLNDFSDDQYIAICLENDAIALSSTPPLIQIEKFIVNGTIKTFETFRKKISDESGHYVLLFIWEFIDENINNKVNMDFLTGLYGRALVNTVRPNEYNICAFIDLDGFKNINDQYGHSEGDRVLKSFANLLVKNVREKDIVIRWGGNEFVIFFKSSTIEEIELKLEKIRSLFECRFFKYKISFSFGLSEISNNIVESIKYADEKMFKSKKIRRDKSIDLDGFYFQFQPKYYKESIFSYEALLRHEKEPNIENFIAKIQNYKDFDVAVVYKFLEYVSTIPNFEKIAFSLNVFPVSIESDSFIELLIKSFEKFEFITIEIIENYCGNCNLDKIKVNVKKLQKHGFYVSMDDFGKGLSNIALFSEIKYDFIKIDRSFVKNIESDTKSLLLMRSIINLLLLTTRSYIVIEGIETKEQMDVIRNMVNMDRILIQGYYYSKPRDISFVKEQECSLIYL